MFAALNFGQGKLVSKIIYLYMDICMLYVSVGTYVHESAGARGGRKN